MIAFALINAVSIEKTIEQLRRIPEVTEAYAMRGRFNVIARISYKHKSPILQIWRLDGIEEMYICYSTEEHDQLLRCLSKLSEGIENSAV